MIILKLKDNTLMHSQSLDFLYSISQAVPKNNVH